MSRKLKTYAVILAITMAITAYISYKALQGLGEAFTDNSDIWDDIE